MSVWIERIAVENLGPLGTQTFQLGRFNLIYGRNETGKTYLVEFLLRSLFRRAATVPLRAELGRGKVTICGLAKDPVDFTPQGREKLEDYWEKNESGLPTNIARLLVVKGGELELTDANRVGIDHKVLKTTLSSEVLIDRILDAIQITVQEAEVINGRIEAAQRGEVKIRESLSEDLERLDKLTEQIEVRYSRGTLRTLQLARKELRSELALQNDAKRHLVHKLFQDQRQLQADREQLPQADIETLKEAVRDHDKTTRDLKRVRGNLTAARDEAKDYPWLQQAALVWESHKLSDAKGPNIWWILSAGFSAIMSVVLGSVGSIFNLIPTATLMLVSLSVVFLVAGIGLGAAYAIKVQRQAAAALESEERRQIETDFKERFGRRLRGLADLRAQLNLLQEAHGRVKNLEERYAEEQTEQEKLETDIRRLFVQLIGEPDPKNEWQAITKSLSEKRDDIDRQLHDIALALRELSVDESDYQAEPALVDYDSERVRDLEVNLDQVEEDLRLAQQDLDNLKQEIARETGDEIGAPWETILENLREHQMEAELNYRQATARILGQIAVCQVVAEIKAQENEKIRQGLQADAVSDILANVTGHYRSLDYADESVIVLSDTADYNLANLSSGAREQVLLALRMGFASRFAAGQPLFLLLDDAFQHSDWRRRQQLVDSALRMVDAGWQITYLTMDDHLRDLISEQGLRDYPDDFVLATV